MLEHHRIVMSESKHCNRRAYLFDGSLERGTLVRLGPVHYLCSVVFQQAWHRSRCCPSLESRFLAAKVIGFLAFRFWLQASQYRPGCAGCATFAATGKDEARCSDICLSELQELVTFGCPFHSSSRGPKPTGGR